MYNFKGYTRSCILKCLLKTILTFELNDIIEFAPLILYNYLKSIKVHKYCGRTIIFILYCVACCLNRKSRYDDLLGQARWVLKFIGSRREGKHGNLPTPRANFWLIFWHCWHKFFYCNYVWNSGYTKKNHRKHVKLYLSRNDG